MLLVFLLQISVAVAIDMRPSKIHDKRKKPSSHCSCVGLQAGGHSASAIEKFIPRSQNPWEKKESQNDRPRGKADETTTPAREGIIFH